MQFRKAQKTDLEKIYSMINELEDFSLDKKKFATIFLNNLQNKSIHYVLAVEKGQIVGFVSLYIQDLLHHADKVAEIQELSVDPRIRGRGIGKKLVNYARAIAKRLDCDSFEAASNIKRKRTHKFYEQKVKMKRTHYKFTQKL